MTIKSLAAEHSRPSSFPNFVVLNKNTSLKNYIQRSPPSAFLIEITSKLVSNFSLLGSVRGNYLGRVGPGTRHSGRSESRAQKVEAIPRGFCRGLSRGSALIKRRSEGRARTRRARAPRRAEPSPTYVAVKNGLGKGTPGATARAGRVIK